MLYNNRPETFEQNAARRHGWVSKAMLALGGVVLFVVGFAAGGTRAEPAPAAAPLPAVTVTQPPVTTTQRVTVEVASPECKQAVAKADAALNIAADGMYLASDAFTAIADYDLDALTATTEKMGDLTPKLQGAMAEYRAAKGKCS